MPPIRKKRSSRPLPTPTVTRLGPRLSLMSLRRRAPLVTPIGQGAWLVQAGGGKRGRVVRRIGPEHLQADLLIDRQSLRNNWQGVQLQLLRHLSVEHVGWLLDTLGVNVVLDVGANRGQYAKALRASGYSGRIVSFEPVPHTADALDRNAAEDPDWHVQRCALGDRDHTMEIHVGVGQGRLSSLLPATEFGRSWNPRIDADQTVPVPVRRLDGILDELLEGVTEPRVYLKLDTQGYDLQAFAGVGDRCADIIAMQSEVSMVPLYEGMPHMSEQLATYQRAGFEIAGMYPVIMDRPTMRVIEFDAIMVRTAGVEADSSS